MKKTLNGRVEVQEILELPAVRMHTVPGFETAVFSFTTDIPFLDRWGEPLLFGPSSIHLAHTADEWIAVDELRDAIDGNVRIARELLTQTS